MKGKIISQIQENPLTTIFLTVLCTAVTVFMTSSFATISYVDRESKKMTEYVDKKHENVKGEIKEIKTSVHKTESRVYDIWVSLNKNK